MLKRLGHWLRAAGYDVLIAEEGESDRSLYQRAIREKRLLISRDRKMAEFRHADEHIFVLNGNQLSDCVAEVSERLEIDWHYHPFSRCLVCNTPLVRATREQFETLPQGVSDSVNRAFYCPHCDQLFWEGSHIRRMRATLENFANKQWEFAG